MKLVDTTVAVDYLRGRGPAELLQELAEVPDDVVVSELVSFEVLAGAREDELPAVEKLLATLEWVPVADTVSRLGGVLARRCRPSHSGIEDVDYRIAATALLLDAELLTTSVRRFPMLEGLSPAY
ncbi:MAG TPA: PIN domain-containing protein [Gaiellaceae bacterium]|nr:PIN domain-containing protein [Gaiellaceae bacterium]